MNIHLSQYIEQCTGFGHWDKLLKVVVLFNFKSQTTFFFFIILKDFVMHNDKINVDSESKFMKNKHFWRLYFQNK